MSTIDPYKFYNTEQLSKHAVRVSQPFSKKKLPKMPSYILGPPNIWLEFNTQAEALVKAFEQSTDDDMLCTFVYQGYMGYRKFVVAHPEYYWWRYKYQTPERRCSYEVIPENSPCRLYLDLEYSIELNPESNGSSMTNTIIDIIGAYLLSYFGLQCNERNALNFDSSTPEKFSRHVIFNIENVAFKDNYHVGRLVKSICNDLSNYISTKENKHDILNRFDRTKLEQLFVKTHKGDGLFIDTAVYTKNRHFRIYKSTKWGKQSNLEISNDCKYISSNFYGDKELNIFMDSLVSYFDFKCNLTLLEFMKSGMVAAKGYELHVPKYIHQECNKCYSKYPLLDMYVRKKIHPATIRVCKHFDSDKQLVYETSGYRYCENIGRCHKSNNVFLIVDLKNKTMYQKCYDSDCSGFVSKPMILPEEVKFQIDDSDDTFLSCVTVDDL